MEKKSLKQKWLNVILHFSSLIYRWKTSLIYAGTLKTILISLIILFLEILLSIISLPFYFFVTAEDDDLSFGDEVKSYRLRRKLTLGILLGFLLFQVVGTILAMFGFGFFYNYLIYGWFLK